MARILLAAVFLAVCLAPGVDIPAAAESDPGLQIKPGMSRQTVQLRLGRPAYERLERNGVRCLVYRTRKPDAHLPTWLWPRDGLAVAVRDGRVTGFEDTLYSEATASCNRLAAGYDPAPRHSATCFRKVYLRCS